MRCDGPPVTHLRRGALRSSGLRLDIVLHGLDVLPVRLHGSYRDGGHRPAVAQRQVCAEERRAKGAHQCRGARASRAHAACSRADGQEDRGQRCNQGDPDVPSVKGAPSLLHAAFQAGSIASAYMAWLSDCEAG